jgi:hypothetical protein
MHNLIMQTSQNQIEQMAELQQVLATLTGTGVVVVEGAKLPDMRSLHPRGYERFSEADLSQRWQAGVHHNALLATIPEGLSAPADEEPASEGEPLA